MRWRHRASILVGPCALEFTKMKTLEHLWSDPPADELVQRHRIHSSSNHHMRPDSPKRPALQVCSMVKRNVSSSSDESGRSLATSARDYVESLHQNNRTTLVYGKNNVVVQPVRQPQKHTSPFLQVCFHNHALCWCFWLRERVWNLLRVTWVCTRGSMEVSVCSGHPTNWWTGVLTKTKQVLTAGAMTFDVQFCRVIVKCLFNSKIWK